MRPLVGTVKVAAGTRARRRADRPGRALGDEAVVGIDLQVAAEHDVTVFQQGISDTLQTVDQVDWISSTPATAGRRRREKQELAVMVSRVKQVVIALIMAGLQVKGDDEFEGLAGAGLAHDGHRVLQHQENPPAR